MPTSRSPKSATALLLSFFILLLGIFQPQSASTADPVKIMVLPFEVNASGDLSYLKSQIAEVLSNHLNKDGAETVPFPADKFQSGAPIATDDRALGQLAGEYGVDRIIWGSFTLIGEKFSLDAYMHSIHDPDETASFNVQGTKLENLLRVLKVLADKISLKLFHREIVHDIRIIGNKRIESEAIKRQVQTKIGSIYNGNQLSSDLKAIYNMGYFDDVRVETELVPQGKTVVFHVKEKPTIRRIRIKGNLKFDDDEIKENLTLTTGSILNIFKVRSNIEQIEAMYKEKNYHQVAVEFKIMPLDNNQADVEFDISEGPKVYVTSITFEGNKSIKARKLKKQIQTSEKGFFYWLTSQGDLDRTKLDQDAALLDNYYSNQGYINARVADPVVDIGKEGIHITFKIDEGYRYKVGKIDVAGDLIKPKEELLKDLTLGGATYFSREKLRGDIIKLTDIYGVYGYAHADVKPKVREDNENKVVDVIYVIKKNQEVYFENIFISGNTRTRDKVIRRELKVAEKERFDGAALKRSIRNLYRLEYFEDIKVDSIKGSRDDLMVLKVDVTEKPTGMFTFGAGYSTEENVYFVGSVSQRNFLGRGQTLKFAGELGTSTTRYNLSFTEPWLFDIPLSGTVFAYDQEKDYDEYDRHSVGSGLGFSYPIFDYTRVYLSYAFDSSDVSAISDDADDTIKELEGTNVTSSVNVAIGYDSRDRTFNTTRGSKHRLSYDYAGLGGDVGYDKIILDTGWYFPLFKGLVGFVRGRGGIVRENDDDKILPDYEKFYLGGINTIRGFDYRGIHLTDINSNGIETKIGGTKMVQFNLEVIFPISEANGLMGVVFFDAGNVYGDSFELGDLRRSAGYGIRWFSPLAPIRIEYGRVLDRREGEDDGQWEFTMGGSF
ncbi:MAG: outer membrane protein assembly factor BamA [Desulfobacteraceae bacterium]